MEQSATTSVDLQHTQLLDAAAHLFATKGFHGTGMRELARHPTAAWMARPPAREFSQIKLFRSL